MDSLLAQSFQDFEIVAVDDCSTDGTPSIIESYAEKFGGRLKFAKTFKNSGSGTLPRNKGIDYACGKYIYLMDNDDALTPTALEELYALAEEYQVDVVHCEKYYNVPREFSNTAESRGQLKPFNYLTGENCLVKEPVIWTNNFEERIKIFAQRKLIWNYWVQLVRRDFIIKNSIKLVGILADDMIFTMCELCCAERYVVVPNVVYLYRQRDDSLIHKRLEPEKHMHRWLSMFKDGIEYLDEFLGEREIFSRRPDLKYVLFDAFAQETLKHLNEIYIKVPVHALDEILRKEFGDGDNAALLTFVFSTMNLYRLQLIQAQNENARLEREFRLLKRKMEEIIRKLKQE